MNSWTNPDPRGTRQPGARTAAQKDPSAQNLPPWERRTRQTEKRKGPRGNGFWKAIGLMAALIAAFALGFGAVYGADYLADRYAYLLYPAASNPTFTRPPEKEDDPDPEPPEAMPEPDVPDSQEGIEEEPDYSPPSLPPPSDSTPLTRREDVDYPVSDAPRITLEDNRGQRELSIAQIAERVTPCVVSVVAYLSDSDEDGYFLGTGTVYSADGYIITNYHVIEDAVRVSIVFPDGSRLDAAHVSSDERADIAILKVEAQDLSFVSFGSSSLLHVGDVVAAIGNPATLELAGTTTAGHITGPERYLPMDNAGNIMRLIQTDASVNPGNSGGPLINAYGQVVGIVTAKLNANTYEGIGFAISSDRLEHIVSDLLQYGYVTGYPALGFTGSTVMEGALDGRNPDGVQVAEISPTSNSYGVLQPGDVIFSVNGQTVRSIPEINAIKGRLEVGDVMVLEVYRKGERFEAEIVLKDRLEVD